MNERNQKNKAIALYVGCEIYNAKTQQKDPNTPEELQMVVFRNDLGWHYINTLSYDSNWSWLMPVYFRIAKENGGLINSLGAINETSVCLADLCDTGWAFTAENENPIDAIYKVVSEFCLDWCEENNEKI